MLNFRAQLCFIRFLFFFIVCRCFLETATEIEIADRSVGYFSPQPFRLFLRVKSVVREKSLIARALFENDKYRILTNRN